MAAGSVFGTRCHIVQNMNTQESQKAFLAETILAHHLIATISILSSLPCNTKHDNDHLNNS
eukprot:scaffold11242_cov106-Cylindrotheca_fusiformis.AAC.2